MKTTTATEVTKFKMCNIQSLDVEHLDVDNAKHLVMQGKTSILATSASQEALQWCFNNRIDVDVLRKDNQTVDGFGFSKIKSIMYMN